MFNIVYGFRQSDAELRRLCKQHGVEIGIREIGKDKIPMIFTGFPGDDGQELQAVLAACQPGVAVWVSQLSNLGWGGKSKEMQDDIKARGAVIKVFEKTLRKRGPKPKHNLTAEQIEKHRTLHDTKTVTRQHVINTILRDTGVALTRHQLRTIFKK